MPLYSELVLVKDDMEIESKAIPFGEKFENNEREEFEW